VEMDLDEAHRLKDAAGYTEPYLAVTLRELLGPKKVNPRFIFAFGNKDTGKPYVFVDTVTKEVGIYSE